MQFRKLTTTLLFAALFSLCMLPRQAFAVPRNILGFVPNTVNLFHDAFVQTLGLMEFGSGTYDPDTGLIDFTINIRDTSNNLIGSATGTGILPGANFNNNNGSLAGHIDFAFDLSGKSALRDFLTSKGLCDSGADAVSALCKDTTYYLDQHYYTAANGDKVNGWYDESDEARLRLWGGSYSYLGVDVHFLIAPVPEPTTMLLFGTGLVGAVGFRRRKKVS